MIDGIFDVVFRGQIVKSFELSDVKANLAKLFKSSPEAIERLFSGQEVPIRKGLDYAAAMKYQSALKNAGALALIKEVDVLSEDAGASDKPVTSATPGKKAVFGGESEVSQNQETPRTGVAPSDNATTTASDSSPVSSNIDNSSVTAQSKENVPDDRAKKTDETDEVQSRGDGSLTVAAPGARILPPKVYENREVDTSDLSLASVGERILPEKAAEKHEKPNIDHLSLVDDK